MTLPCPLTLMRWFKLFFFLCFLVMLLPGAFAVGSFENLRNADLAVFLQDQEDASARGECSVPTKMRSPRVLLTKRRSSVFISPLVPQGALLRTSDCSVRAFSLSAAAVNFSAALYQFLGVYRC